MRYSGLFLILLAAGCGSGNEARFLIDPPAATAEVPVRVATIELREVSLPAYAAAVEIAQQEETGALRNLPETLWADDPVRGVTIALARALDQATTATAAAEPWPLDEPAQARVEVRVERMFAGTDGQFRFAGQYAIASPDGVIRERVQRFDIAIPIAAEGAAGIAEASGNAISRLALDIASDLRR
ncbi:MAG: ABC-type transport auxiliary lipoprotein family protein [Albidovulum sp.]|uniref:PqiC family protein n=1 Tax=Albidovulum sp. TaxID=1872424 RepID=UPI003C96D032